MKGIAPQREGRKNISGTFVIKSSYKLSEKQHFQFKEETKYINNIVYAVALKHFVAIQKTWYKLPTHALTENWIVCRSQRKGVGLASALADVPEVLDVDPASLQAMCCRNAIR